MDGKKWKHLPENVDCFNFRKSVIVHRKMLSFKQYLTLKLLLVEGCEAFLKSSFYYIYMYIRLCINVYVLFIYKYIHTYA